MEYKSLFKKEEIGQNLAAVVTWFAVAVFDFLNPPQLFWLPWIIGLHLTFIVSIFLLNPKELQRKSKIVDLAKVGVALVCVFGLTLIYRTESLDHILLILIAASLPAIIDVKHGYIIMAFSLVILAALLFYFIESLEAWMTLAYSCGFVLFAFQNSVQRITTEQTKQKLAEKNAELLKARDMLSQNARNKERLRISRDLHDILGHQLTALNLNLETVYQKTPSENRHYLEISRNLAKELLQDVRGVVRSMRDDAIVDLKPLLQAFADQFPKLKLTFELSKEFKFSNPLLGECLLRCCQEAITNAVRHGNADQIMIQLFSENDQTNLVIQDNGVSSNSSSEGTGILGMKERLKKYNGRLTFEKTPNSGWRLIISLPGKNNEKN